MYKELKTSYRQKFNRELLDSEAYEVGTRLLALTKVIIAHQQNKKLH